MAFNKTAGSFESTEGGEAKYYYQKNKLERLLPESLEKVDKY